MTTADILHSRLLHWSTYWWYLNFVCM